MNLNHQEEIQAYLNQVCAQVKFREVHKEIRKELESHIQEIVQEYSAQGFSEEEAVAKALAQMGVADIVGKQLNKVHRPRPAWSVLVLSLLFINTGLLAMYFIQKQGLLTYDIPIFAKSLHYSFISLIFIAGLYFFDYRKLEGYAKHIYLGTFFLLFFTVFQGIQVNGSKCWLSLGPFTVNVVTITPLFFSIALAGLFNKWDWHNPLKLLQGFLILAGPLFLILTAPSIATGVIYAATCLVIMIVSGAGIKAIGLIWTPLAAMLILPVITAPYRLVRLLTFFNPAADPLGNGYLSLQLRKIISESGLFGQGLTFHSRVLPDLHTDFIFAFITYTFGWLASSLLIIFIVIFLIRAASVARQVKLGYGKLLTSSFVTILAVQFLWNIGMNLGLTPISDVGLPFISYGGSQLIFNVVAVGMISGIYRQKTLA
ncbi:MAG: FtsW/RodA/SpoVE family cell cycle protein [Peptococcaceae bacterium]